MCGFTIYVPQAVKFDLIPPEAAKNEDWERENEQTECEPSLRPEGGLLTKGILFQAAQQKRISYRQRCIVPRIVKGTGC